MDVEIVLDEVDLHRVWRVEKVLHGTVIRVGFRGNGRVSVLVSGGKADVLSVQALLDPLCERAIDVHPHIEPDIGRPPPFFVMNRLAC